MEKQIEEMAKIIADNFDGYDGKKYEPYDFEWCAYLLHGQGYRKQVQAEWIDLHKGKYENPLYVCSACRKGAYLKIEADELNNPKMVQALTDYCPHCSAKMKGN